MMLKSPLLLAQQRVAPICESRPASSKNCCNFGRVENSYGETQDVFGCSRDDNNGADRTSTANSRLFAYTGRDRAGQVWTSERAGDSDCQPVTERHHWRRYRFI